MQHLIIAIESLSVEVVTAATAAQLRAPPIAGARFARLARRRRGEGAGGGPGGGPGAMMSDAFAEATASYAAVARFTVRGVRLVMALRPRAATLFEGADARSIKARRQLPLLKLQCDDARVQVQDLHQLMWIDAVESVGARLAVTQDGLVSLSLAPRLQCNLSPTVVAGLSAAAQALGASATLSAVASSAAPPEAAARAEGAAEALPELRYLITNRTGEALWFGQCETPEALRLAPLRAGSASASAAYSLWRCTSEPTLHFALERTAVDLFGTPSAPRRRGTYGVWSEEVRLRVGCHCRMVRVLYFLPLHFMRILLTI